MNSNRKKKEILVCWLVAASILMVVDRNADADFVFDQAHNSGPIINTSRHEIEPIPEPLLMWFARRNASNEWEEWTVSRATENDSWENPVNYGPWDESDWNLIKSTPSHTTADGLELYFYASEERKPDGYGRYDIWMKKRENMDDDWGPAINLGPTVNNNYDQALPAISPDGLELYYSGWDVDAGPGGSGKSDLWITRRSTRDEPWGEPDNLGPTVNSASFDARPILVADGLLLLFESERPGGYGSSDLYMMKRATISDQWSEPMNLGPNVNGPDSDEQAFLSPDCSTVYFHSNRSGGYGGYDIWQVSIKPIVDLNGDGIVNADDVCIIVDHWGEDYSLCDIGPTPFGDGIVDVEDLKVLAGHLFEEIGLVAHWKLDETEGDTAHDSIEGNDGFGPPDLLWRPEDGKVGGALELDGIDDSIVTSFSLNPAQGSFSAFTWIKGGGPGQVALSQNDGVDWLLADEDGHFMTALRRGSSGRMLTSGYVITDGDWHHIGVIWDGMHRHLYADGVEAAEDTTNLGYLSASNGSLCIGCGNAFDAGTFFSGLIDDIRIYDRALSKEEIASLAH
jgi:hypothetical protein